MTYTNRLIKETSPYLLQHAHNPVDWYAWGPEALEKAKRENKPIFLSIGYSACHWCHVMEEESFSSPEIAAVMNRHFVSIKVDREERPDLDDIYMNAVQMMTGSGGWPMSVFLTPDLKPFFGGTYFPPDDRYGRPGFKSVLQQIADSWQNRRSDIDQFANRVSLALEQATAAKPESKEVDPTVIAKAVESASGGFDSTYGGFGSAPKFPPSLTLELLLTQDQQKPDEKVREMVETTLDFMARGGVYDQVGFGFHRYSTDRVWLVPHFEKMLYDNALLSRDYVLAYQVFKKPFYRRIAEQIYEFISRETTDPEGGFYSTIDADAEGEEGKFYVWTKAEVEQVLGESDGKLFCDVYDISTTGNFEGKNIPHLARTVEDWAKTLNRNPQELQSHLDRLREKLLEVRGKRVRPHLDDKILTDWNGLMISSYARAFTVLGNSEYRTKAEKTANFILSKMTSGDTLFHTYRNGERKLPSFLDDYAFFIEALLDLSDATQDAKWFSEARRLTDAMIARFWDQDNGGFFFTASDHNAPLVRTKSAQDNVTPSGNSVAILSLLRLAEKTSDQTYLRLAEKGIGAFGDLISKMPTGFAYMLLAVDRLNSPALASLKTKTTTPLEPSDLVTLTGYLSVDKVQPGRPFRLAVDIAIKKGWHINSHRPNLDYLIPTKIGFDGLPKVKVRKVEYPSGADVKLGFADEALSVYQDTVRLVAEMELADGVKTRTGNIAVTLNYQACDDEKCLRPTKVTAEIPVSVASKGEAVQSLHPEIFGGKRKAGSP